jgi:hypothetical protein
MMKNVNKVRSITTEYADTVQLSASWPSMAGYRWTGLPNTPVSRTVPLVANRAGTYPVTVSDAQQCLTDQFTIMTLPPPILTARTAMSACAGSTITVTATPENTTKATGWQYDILLSDASGSFTREHLIGSGTLANLKAILPVTLPAASGYRIQVRPRGIPYVQLIATEAFTLKPTATATLTGTASVQQGSPASLTLTFSGEGPWKGTLSTGQSFSASTSPAVVTVRPTQTTTYAVASVENSCGAGTATGQAVVTVLLPTEIEPFAGGYVQIYPNPAQDVVYVTLSAGAKKETALQLRDLQGKMIYQKKFSSATLVQEPVPLPDSRGAYLLTVQVGQQTITRKVVRD